MDAMQKLSGPEMKKWTWFNFAVKYLPSFPEKNTFSSENSRITTVPNSIPVFENMNEFGV